MKIVKTPLPEIEYFMQEREKDLIVYHHTVSAVGKYVADWFKHDMGKSRVAVAYVVEKDGTVYQLFDDKYWGYHTGTGNHNRIDERSVAIEVVNEGPLHYRKGDGFYWWIDAQYPEGKYRYSGEVVEVCPKYRGVEYFAGYTDAQVDSLLKLTGQIMDKHPGILPKFSDEFEFDKKYFSYSGIIMHVNVRKDKSDLSPAFDLKKVNNFLKSRGAYGLGDLKGKRAEPVKK